MKFWRSETTSDGVVLARYNNPPMNYFCAEAGAELQQLIAVWQDPSVRAVVLTGEVQGRFITHYSVEELVAFGSDREQMEHVGIAMSLAYHALLASLAALSKPVIAAINGDCMGGGLELSLWCDLRIMSQGDYRIGLPESRLGIMPGGSGTQKLGRLLGCAKALELLLFGKILQPDAALAVGLIHEVAEDARTRALALASELAKLNPGALAMIKHAVHTGMEQSLADGLNTEAIDFLEVMRSPDALTVMQRYLDIAVEKRRDWLE
jgi:enoyl-CoA hydratase/carnithine racemase